MDLILASGSERRRELLSWLGVPFTVVTSQVNEALVRSSNPQILVKRLAIAKARAVQRRITNHESRIKGLKEPVTCLVIGADTVVFIDGETIGKPKDEKDAVRILRKLSGEIHTVYTGITVVDALTKKSVSAVEKTFVMFRKLSDEEINDYVVTGEPLDKGGGYAIQMGAKGFVADVRGSFTNVVGLPLVVLGTLLRKQGFWLKRDVSKIVFEKTGYLS